MKLRDAERTKTRLLEAARQRFRACSFGDVKVRDIAADAGVTAGLVNRYFGGKEDLYRAVLASIGNGHQLFDGARADFGERTARAILDSVPGDRLADFFLIAVRAVGSARAILLIQHVAASWNTRIEAWIDRPDAKQRAFLITGTILGVMLRSELAGAPSGSVREIDALRARLAQSLQAYLDGP